MTREGNPMKDSWIHVDLREFEASVLLETKRLEIVGGLGCKAVKVV